MLRRFGCRQSGEFGHGSSELGSLASPALLRADTLNQGKSTAQLFGIHCGDCHKSPRGLAKNGSPGSVATFLREHYTTGKEQAAALADYLVTGKGGAPAPATRTPKAAGPAGGTDQPADASRAQGATGPRPRTPAASAEPASPRHATQRRSAGRRRRRFGEIQEIPAHRQGPCGHRRSSEAAKPAAPAADDAAPATAAAKPEPAATAAPDAAPSVDEPRSCQAAEGQARQSRRRREPADDAPRPGRRRAAAPAARSSATVPTSASPAESPAERDSHRLRATRRQAAASAAAPPPSASQSGGSRGRAWRAQR